MHEVAALPAGPLELLVSFGVRGRVALGVCGAWRRAWIRFARATCGADEPVAQLGLLGEAAPAAGPFVRLALDVPPWQCYAKRPAWCWDGCDAYGRELGPVFAGDSADAAPVALLTAAVDWTRLPQPCGAATTGVLADRFPARRWLAPGAGKELVPVQGGALRAAAEGLVFRRDGGGPDILLLPSTGHAVWHARPAHARVVVVWRADGPSAAPRVALFVVWVDWTGWVQATGLRVPAGGWQPPVAWPVGPPYSGWSPPAVGPWGLVALRGRCAVVARWRPGRLPLCPSPFGPPAWVRDRPAVPPSRIGRDSGTHTTPA